MWYNVNMDDLFYLMSMFSDEPPEPGVFSSNVGDHLTLLNGFTVPDVNIPQFIEQLHTLAASTASFMIIPVKEATYGDYAVWEVVEETGVLVTLHQNFCSLVKSNNGLFYNPFYEEKYSPHVSNWVEPKPHMVEHFILVRHQGGFGVNVTVEATFQLHKAHSV